MSENNLENKKLPEVTIYTDGACFGNPGPGGYAAIIIHSKGEKEVSGCEPQTTNNRMEMRAILEALSVLKKRCKVTVYTDSQYLKKGFTEWLPRWQKNNWVTSGNKPVKNKDLWEKLVLLCEKHEVNWKWIRGHKGDKYNQRCDILAKNAISRCLKEEEENEMS